MSRTGSFTRRRLARTLVAGGALAGLSGALPGHSTAGATPDRGRSGGKAHAVIGVAAYRVGADGTLDGIWTIEAYAGRLGTEFASGGTPGRIAGTYHVLIHDPDGRQDFEGTLTIVANQAAYQMTWTGTDGTRYEGLGLRQGEDMLSAVYWGPVT